MSTSAGIGRSPPRPAGERAAQERATRGPGRRCSRPSVYLISPSSGLRTSSTSAASTASCWFFQWLVTSLTESRTLIGLVSFIQGGVIFATSPLSGVAVDRLPRRRILVAGRVGIALAALCPSRRWWPSIASRSPTCWQSSFGGPGPAHVRSCSPRPRPTSSTWWDARSLAECRFAQRGRGRSGADPGAACWAGRCWPPRASWPRTSPLAAGPASWPRDSCCWFRCWASRGIGARESHWWADLEEGLVLRSARHRAVLLALIVCSMSVFNGALMPPCGPSLRATSSRWGVRATA